MKIRALVAASLFLIALPWVPGAEAGTLNIVEDFENDAVLSQPDDDLGTWETTGTVSAFVTSTLAKNGNNSLTYTDNGGSVAGAAGWALNFDMCEGGSVTFWFQYDSSGTNDLTFGLDSELDTDTNTPTDAFAGVYIHPSGAASVRLTDGTASGSLGTLSNGTWYDISISNIDCAAASARIGSGTLGLVYDLDATGTMTDLDYFIFSDLSTTTTSGMRVYIDDLTFSGVDFAPPVAADATVAITNLTGFDVDFTGTTAITRHSDGNVTAWSASSLSQGASIDTLCNTSDQVAVLPGAVSFMQCATDGGNDVDTLSIRSPSLGAVDWPQACDDYCVADIPTVELSGNQAETREMAEVRAFPFDFSVTETRNQLDRTYLAWAFSEQTTGKVGVVTYTQRNNAADTSDIATRVLDPSGSPQVDHICTMTIGDVNWLVAGSQNVATKAYKVTLTRASQLSVAFLEASMDLGTTVPQPNAVGVGCGAGRVLVHDSSGVVKVFTTAGVLVADVGTNGDAANRGASLSGNGLWGAYTTSSGVRIFNASNGDTVALLQVPAGNFESVHVDFKGQRAWVATDENLAVYTIYPYTTGDPVGISGDETAAEVGGSVTQSGDGVLSGAGAAAGGAFGVSDTAGGFFFGFIVIAATTTAGIAGLPQARVLGAVGGAIGGLVLGWVLGFIPSAFMFALVVLAGGAIAYKLFNGREMGA